MHIHRVVLHYFLIFVFLYFIFFCIFCGTTAGADPGFPVGGGADPGGGQRLRRQHMILSKFPKNCMKSRKFWAVAGRTPLKSATALIPLFCASGDVSSGF